ncbi:hypothetical protein D9M72_558050 [compost metagenome]
MPGKGQFGRRRKDPQPVIRLRVRRLQQKCGLGQVGPVREALHLFCGQSVRVMDDGDGVPGFRARRKDVYLGEGIFVHNGGHAGLSLEGG